MSKFYLCHSFTVTVCHALGGPATTLRVPGTLAIRKYRSIPVRSSQNELRPCIACLHQVS